MDTSLLTHISEISPWRTPLGTCSTQQPKSKGGSSDIGWCKHAKQMR